MERSRARAAATILIIGDPGVGKTLLSKRVLNGSALDDFQTEVTIDPDFVAVTYDFGTDRKYTVNFVDVPGGVRARSLVASYYRGVDAIIAVYDVTAPRTFDSLRDEWLPAAGDMVGKDNTPLLVIANKIDLWKRDAQTLTNFIDSHTRDINLRLHDRLMLKENIVPASALVWRFPDRETPIDNFVYEVLTRKAEAAGDMETSGRIALFTRDFDERSARDAADSGVPECRMC